MTHRWFVTRDKLDRALARVRRELEQHGFWRPRLAEVSTRLIWLAPAHGYYFGRKAGTIVIPAISACRAWEIINGQYQGFCNVVRHEHGHAICRTYPALFRTRQFASAFGSRLPSGQAYEYDPTIHVSAYAATNSEEWFCETFMYYLQFAGRLPKPWRGTPIRVQWNFIREMAATLTGSGR